MRWLGGARDGEASSQPLRREKREHLDGGPCHRESDYQLVLHGLVLSLQGPGPEKRTATGWIPQYWIRYSSSTIQNWTSCVHRTANDAIAGRSWSAFGLFFKHITGLVTRLHRTSWTCRQTSMNIPVCAYGCGQATRAIRHDRMTTCGLERPGWCRPTDDRREARAYLTSMPSGPDRHVALT